MNELLVDLKTIDPEIFELCSKETEKQRRDIRLIASENYASRAVKEASASNFGNKYSEGYPYKWKDGERTTENGRYYQGQEFTNRLELLAIERALKLFTPGVESLYHANLQPLSGAPANFAVLNAFLNPGDRLLGLSLDYGGHLTHGHKVNATAKFFAATQFPLGAGDLLDYDIIRKCALDSKPKVMIIGTTSYPRAIDFSILGSIAKEVGAILVADIAHISGLVAMGLLPHPFPHADVITMTTHKILRGPRGGLILCKKELGPAIDRSVFPALQGGPHMHIIAGIAVALHEALQPSYRSYSEQVIRNAKALADSMLANGFNLVSGGTDSHMVVSNIVKSAERLAGLDGAKYSEACERAGLVFNKNAVPGDAKPWIPSGIRLGTPSVTTIGMREGEMKQIADWLARVAEAKGGEAITSQVRKETLELMGQFECP